MKLRKNVIALGAAIAVTFAGGVAAVASTTTETATCTPSPTITTASSTEGFDVHCDVPLPAPVTSTVTSTVTVTASPTSSTTSPAPTSSTTSSSPSPTSSSATTSSSSSWVMPDATNTGPQGCSSFTPLTATGSDSFGPIYQMTAGQKLDCVSFDGSLETADNTTVTNSKIGAIRATNVNTVLVDHVTASWIGVDSSANVTYQYVHVTPQDDAIDVAEDANGADTNISILHNFIDVPNGFASNAHVDGLQVRGVSGMKIEGNRFAPGPYKSQFNSAVYLEDQYSGNTNVTVDHNWLSGYGYTVMIDSNTGYSFTNNVLEVPGDGDANWGYCTAMTTPSTETGNTDGSTGAAITPC